MLMNKNMFFKKVFEMIKTDESYYNVVCQVINDFELDGYTVGEWVKEDKTLMSYIKSEFGKVSKINDLF